MSRMDGPPQPSPADAGGIRWGRVAKYAAVAFCATFFVGCAVGFAAGVRGGPAPAGLVVARAVGVPLAMVAVFAWVGRAEQNLTAAYASAVWVATVVISFVCNVLILRSSLTTFCLSTVVIAACAAVGTGIGVALRPRRR